MKKQNTGLINETDHTTVKGRSIEAEHIYISKRNEPVQKHDVRLKTLYSWNRLKVCLIAYIIKLNTHIV